jgi:membrane protein YqaA with SNARE-associated domain
MIDLFHMGYLGLFLACFMAATILPLSSEAILSSLIIMGYNIPVCIITATAGNWLGGMSSYFLGYLGKTVWIEKYLRVRKDKIEKMKIFLFKKGGYFAFFCWLPLVGDLIAVTLGLIRCNVYKVAAYMLAGKAVRYIISGYLTFVVGEHYDLFRYLE